MQAIFLLLLIGIVRAANVHLFQLPNQFFQPSHAMLNPQWRQSTPTSYTPFHLQQSPTPLSRHFSTNQEQVNSRAKSSVNIYKAPVKWIKMHEIPFMKDNQGYKQNDQQFKQGNVVSRQNNPELWLSLIKSAQSQSKQSQLDQDSRHSFHNSKTINVSPSKLYQELQPFAVEEAGKKDRSHNVLPPVENTYDVSAEEIHQEPNHKPNPKPHQSAIEGSHQLPQENPSQLPDIPTSIYQTPTKSSYQNPVEFSYQAPIKSYQTPLKPGKQASPPIKLDNALKPANLSPFEPSVHTTENIFNKEPNRFSFSYGVDDFDSYYNPVFFSHQQSKLNHQTTGRYEVLLPDTRLMRVEYIADQTGYHPVITYKGVAVYA